MDISNFSRTISKSEWDSHIDFLANEDVINPNKGKIYSSLVDYIDRNVSDEKFGVLLSGGIDSSLIARICQQKQYNFRCFCVVNTRSFLEQKQISNFPEWMKV